jgi:hypothetical protein
MNIAADAAKIATQMTLQKDLSVAKTLNMYASLHMNDASHVAATTSQINKKDNLTQTSS